MESDAFLAKMGEPISRGGYTGIKGTTEAWL